MADTQASSPIRYRAEPSPSPRNVGDNERWASLIGGAMAAVLGLRRGGPMGLLLGAVGAGLIYRGASGHCPVYQRIGRNTAGPDAVQLRTGITINRDPQSLYTFWRDFSRLPQVMKFLAEVSPEREGRSHWVAAAPMGRVEWDSEVVTDVPGERIAWRSLAGSDLDSQGEVRFRPGPQGRGTEVELYLRYQPSGAAAGGAAARFLRGASEEALKEDLRRFKRLMEAGEIPTSDITVH